MSHPCLWCPWACTSTHRTALWTPTACCIHAAMRASAVLRRLHVWSCTLPPEAQKLLLLPLGVKVQSDLRTWRVPRNAPHQLWARCQCLCKSSALAGILRCAGLRHTSGQLT